MASFNSEVNEHKWINVQDVQCVVWMFPSGKAPKQEASRRQNLKDKLGKLHPDTVMLDTKSAKSQRLFCDAIVYSDHIKSWDTVFRQFYSNFELKTKAVSGGHQLIISNSSTKNIFITVSFYLGSGKLMVQPGGRSEDNLLKWLKSFPQLLHFYTSLEPSSSGAIMKQANAPAAPTAPSILTPTHTQASYKDAVTQGKDVFVDLPPIIEGQSRQPAVIVNELLTFALNKLNVLPLDMVVKLCTDFYADEEIAAAKRALFKNAHNVKVRYSKHHGPTRGSLDMKDIATVLLSIEPKDMPIFVARDLGNLPPINATNFDVVKILQEVQNVKESVKLLCDSQASLADTVKQKMSGLPAGQLPVAEQISQHQPQDMGIDQSETSSNNEEYIVVNYTSCSEDADAHADDTLHDDTAFANAMFHTSHHNTGLPEDKLYPSPVRHGMLHGSSSTDSYIRPAAGNRNSSPTHPPYQRQKSDMVHGTGWTTVIKPAKSSKERPQTHSSQSNRMITGVFVTQLDPKTSPMRLKDFIRRETGLHVRPEKLNTKYSTYGSFYIPADRSARDTLLNASLWPRGCKLKPFYS